VYAFGIVSIDIYKATVVCEVLACGVVIVNDISGFQFDGDLFRVVVESGVVFVLMYNRGRSKEMYREVAYGDVVFEIRCEFDEVIVWVIGVGVVCEVIIVDLGFGFAKCVVYLFVVFVLFDVLCVFDWFIFCGFSRKSFLMDAMGDKVFVDRDWGIAVAVVASVLFGAHIVRVHCVVEMIDVVRVVDCIFQVQRFF